jgi:hypothetical protein
MKSTEALLDTSRKVRVQMHLEVLMNSFLSRHQNAGQAHDIKIVSISFGNRARVLGNHFNKSKLHSGMN